MLNMRVQYILIYIFFIPCSLVRTAEIPYETFCVTYAHIQLYIYRSMEFVNTPKNLQRK